MVRWCKSNNMEITVSFRHGPLDVELQSEDREALQEDLPEFVNFLNQNQEKFGELNTPIGSEQQSSEENPDLLLEYREQKREGAKDNSESSSTKEGSNNESAKFSKLVERTRLDEDVLNTIYEIPDNENEPPYLNLFQFDENTKVLGDYRNQQQALSSALILYAWEMVRGDEKVSYEELDTALNWSEIDVERRDAMTQAFGDDARNWFDRDEGERIGLTTPGKQRARRELRELAELMKSE